MCMCVRAYAWIHTYIAIVSPVEETQSMQEVVHVVELCTTSRTDEEIYMLYFLIYLMENNSTLTYALTTICV